MHARLLPQARPQPLQLHDVDIRGTVGPAIPELCLVLPHISLENDPGLLLLNIIDPIKLHTGLRPNSAWIPYTLLLRIVAIRFPTWGFYVKVLLAGRANLKGRIS